MITALNIFLGVLSFGLGALVSYFIFHLIFECENDIWGFTEVKDKVTDEIVRICNSVKEHK